MTRPTLREAAELSLFASRSLKAMVPGDDEAERLARFEALAAEPWSRERIRREILRAADSEQLSLALRKLRRDIMLTLIGRNATGACGFHEGASLPSAGACR